MKNNIFFFIGTKAQAIKCLPLLRKFVQEEICKVYIVDSGQHAEIVESILKEFSKKDVTRINLNKDISNITTFSQSIIWVFNFIIKFLIFNNTSQFNIKNGICIIHGDTLSTIMGLLWSKKNKLKTLHLESGLTSKKLLSPFPEELIRRTVSRFSDILIAFDENSYNYLINKYKNKFIKRVSENTIVETINIQNEKIVPNTALVTLHRTENLVSKRNLEKFINFLNNLSKSHSIDWYLHEPTFNYLEKHKLNIPKNIKTHNLVGHELFIEYLAKADVVITDGGSIQEECYFLGKKTVIWRKTTERVYALNNNMFISEFNIDESLNFIFNNKNFSIKNINYLKPSQEIFDYLNNLFFKI
jgi:UDP-N-acetylglucosamine 2-epimerase (non-hydrolysing)